MPIDLTRKRIIVTGGAGFLGKALVANLHRRGCQTVFVPLIENYDLTSEGEVARMYRDMRPQIVFHLAALVGGIGANSRRAGEFFYANAKMGIEVMEYARRAGVEKFIQVGTICSYPKHSPIPFREEDLYWEGYPEETNAAYGLAKKMLLVQAQAYRQQYGFNAIYLLPVNLYGPGDNFDPESSHVIPALIRKCLEARDSGASEIVCWGTGRATREFLYVEDGAEGIALAAEHYSDGAPVNLGAGAEIPIKDLVEIIARHTGYQRSIVWDHSKPDGQPRRKLDTSRAESAFGFRAKMLFEEGLRRSIDYFEALRGPAEAVQLPCRSNGQ